MCPHFVTKSYENLPQNKATLQTFQRLDVSLVNGNAKTETTVLQCVADCVNSKHITFIQSSGESPPTGQTRCYETAVEP